jgi:hypothetical protein
VLEQERAALETERAGLETKRLSLEGETEPLQCVRCCSDSEIEKSCAMKIQHPLTTRNIPLDYLVKDYPSPSPGFEFLDS